MYIRTTMLALYIVVNSEAVGFRTVWAPAARLCWDLNNIKKRLELLILQYSDDKWNVLLYGRYGNYVHMYEKYVLNLLHFRLYVHEMDSKFPFVDRDVAVTSIPL
jgi:hypothetical protein